MESSWSECGICLRNETLTKKQKQTNKTAESKCFYPCTTLVDISKKHLTLHGITQKNKQTNKNLQCVSSFVPQPGYAVAELLWTTLLSVFVRPSSVNEFIAFIIAQSVLFAVVVF